MADRILPGGLGIKAFWDLGFNGWNTDMDANLRILSALAGMSALSLVGADPGAPTDGDVHLLSAAHPTHPGEIAIRDDGAWVYIAVPVGRIMFDAGTAQHRYFDGTTWTVLAVAGGDAAVIGGVTLDGINNLFVPALDVVDSPYVAVSFWVRYNDAGALANAYHYVSDPAGGFATWSAPWLGANAGKLGAEFALNDESEIDSYVGGAVLPNNEWIHFLIVFKGVNDGTNNNVIAAYRNRVSDGGVLQFDASISISPELSGFDFYVGSSAATSPVSNFDMAEFWLCVGTDLLESDGTISDATLDKFVTADLKPVALGATGQLPTGTTPAIYLHRDAAEAASTFAVNLGTGGALTCDDPTALADPVDNPGD